MPSNGLEPWTTAIASLIFLNGFIQVSIVDAKSYVSAIRENILAGGDICSRAIMIGACLGQL